MSKVFKHTQKKSSLVPIKLTALTNGVYASSERYAKVVPESKIVPALEEVVNTEESMGSF